MSWQHKLAYPVPYKKQQAMKLMIEAAEGGDIEAATKQLELALLIDGALWMAKAN